ncbi:MAG TPA: hypothetical protein VJ962_04310 [Clostridia bacterium]|nr:hypothetical protein [Clostridia bacterium]
MTFEVKYLNRDEEKRDRFQVEFTQKEREQFLEMQLFLNQTKDATAMKQMAQLGWLAISNHDDFVRYLRECLFINARNNKRLGIDVQGELENKFQLKFERLGWKMYL